MILLSFIGVAFYVKMFDVGVNPWFLISSVVQL